VTNPHSPAISSRSRLVVCAAIALLAATFPAGARAQAPDPHALDRARELFVQATELREAGDARGALEKFRAARDLAPNPVTTIELGRTYAVLGMLLEAREAFLSIAHIPIQPDETPRATQARQDAAKLADDAKEQIDRIVASARAQTAETRSLSPAPSPEDPPALPSPSESTGVGPIAYVGFGVGVAGFVTGTVLGVIAMSKASDAQDACSGDTTGACQQTATDDLQTARGLGYASIVTFGIAGLGVAVGIVDLLVNPPRAKEARSSSIRIAPWIAPGGGGLRGSF
jgi:hypothetical protein